MRLKMITALLMGVIGISLFSTACGGGSGGTVEVFVDGSIGRLVSSSVSREFVGVGAVAFSGVQVCCADSCDTSDDLGSFTFKIETQERRVSCLVSNEEFSQSFSLANLTRVGTYQLSITVTEVSQGDFSLSVDGKYSGGEPDTPPECGNSIAEAGGGEDCDGSDLAGNDCFSIGFSKGQLGCNADCSFDTSLCETNDSPICGDGIIEGAEACDAENLGGQTCMSLGFIGGGVLDCAPDCEFDTSMCSNTPDANSCGNGVVEQGKDEECDGADLAGETCESLGQGSGTLSCLDSCEFNFSQCSSVPTCSEEQKVCQNTGVAAQCLSCSCNDGFNIGSCESICLDTMQPPTICSGGFACSDGSSPQCPG